ncbi:unnamed protein product [Albugo candida]|uniref:Proteasome assembly chaperone 1 n=1 Tax=Albugo candida TaxID=65357 RepID=A0A024GHW9_9STRA|nr:unnamed protein product [Albugo candida]|eukprot:CCI46316.1 unnamed protein product [Albugo candida]
MAISLRFPEEAILSSRAFDVTEELDFLNEKGVPETMQSDTPKAFMRWNCQLRQAQSTKFVNSKLVAKSLLVAAPGSAQHLMQAIVTSGEWNAIGAIVVTSLLPTHIQLKDPSLTCGCTVYSSHSIHDAAFGDLIVIICAQEIPNDAMYVWLKAIQNHFQSDEILCLDSHMRTIYSTHEENLSDTAVMKMLFSSATKSGDLCSQGASFPIFQTPQFVTGVSAALLTHGEIKNRCVRLYICTHSASTTKEECVRCFLPLLLSLNLESCQHQFQALCVEEAPNLLYI